MDLYSIRWKHSARKELKKLSKPIILKIIAVIEELSKEPLPKQCRKIIGTEHTYRIRIGDYRIIYSLESKQLLIEIIRVGHRKNIYKNLK